MRVTANYVPLREVLGARPCLPYRSHTVDSLSGVTVAVVDDGVVIDGLAHTCAAALELSAAIAQAVTATTLTARRPPQKARP